MIKNFRDLTLISVDSSVIAIACDSCGGIGEKEHDIIKVDPEITGYYTACVTLSEIIAVGATPITVIDTLSVEMEETGKKIIKGIRKAIKEIDLDDEVLITGSTEENIPVTLTGIGLTALGKINTKNWKQPKAKNNDYIIVIGKPKVGNEVLKDKGEILTLGHLIEIKKLDFITDILPVGSKGILHEVNEMARTSQLEFEIDKNCNIDLHTSGGPATCAVIAINPDYYKQLKSTIELPITKIGHFVSSI